jgi:hypothetical protein
LTRIPGGFGELDIANEEEFIDVMGMYSKLGTRALSLERTAVM